jgi:hypothetical protein
MIQSQSKINFDEELDENLGEKLGSNFTTSKNVKRINLDVLRPPTINFIYLYWGVVFSLMIMATIVLIAIFVIYYLASASVFDDLFLGGEKCICNFDQSPSTFEIIKKNYTNIIKIEIKKENWNEVNFLSLDPYWFSQYPEGNLII